MESGVLAACMMIDLFKPIRDLDEKNIKMVSSGCLPVLVCRFKMFQN